MTKKKRFLSVSVVIFWSKLLIDIKNLSRDRTVAEAYRAKLRAFANGAGFVGQILI